MKKSMWMMLLFAALFTGQQAMAETRTVACDGCGELEYAKIALRATDGGEAVVVVDASNQNVRKYLVMNDLGDFRDVYSKTAYRMQLTTSEDQLYGGALEVAAAWSDGNGNVIEACGPGGPGDWLVPDFGFSLACDFHDECYARGGDEEDRSACDHQLFSDMVSFGAAVQMATSYFLAVRTAGWMYFNYRGRHSTASADPLGGCRFLIVCDYTSMVDIPWPSGF